MPEFAQPKAAESEAVKHDTEPAAAQPAIGATAEVAGPKAPMAGLIVQRKLRVGHAADPAEVEADQMADSIVARLRSAPNDRDAETEPATGATARVDEHSPIERIVSRQRSSAGGIAGGDVDADTEQAIGAISGTGQALASPVRRAMEKAMGTDLSAVRIHSGPTARDLNDRLGAEAFTVGNNIVFRSTVPDLSSPAGAHLLAHELTHVVQQGAAPVRRQATTIRRARTALTTKEVIGMVKGIPELGSQLESVFREKSTRTRIDETLHAYKEHVAKKKDEELDIRDAMMLSTALGEIAKVFADALNDPSAAMILLPKMVDTFEAEIGKKLKSKWSLGHDKKAHARVMSLTKALSGGDPVTQYMHREIGLDAAAAQITQMAGKDKSLTPEKVLELMTERFHSTMSTYADGKQASLVKDPVGSFNRAEAHGEYSKYFFERTFGSATPKWEAGDKGGSGAEQLELTDEAKKKLADLKREVLTPKPVTAVKARDGVTEKQERHLAAVEQSDKDAPSPDAQFQEMLSNRFFITSAAAATLLVDIKKFLRTDMKVTITADASKWFGKDDAPKKPDANFAAAASSKKTTTLADLFGKKGAAGTIDHLPTWDDKGAGASARGKSYLRFRQWKDQLMTGLQDMTSTELPVFGAGNITWETVKGSDTAVHGDNYYGNIHFVVDRNKIKDRMVFTAGDHGTPHRDPFLAVWEFCSEGRGLTWVRDNIQDLAIVDNIVNAIRGKKPFYGVGLKLEWQCFGGIDMQKDVLEVVLSSSQSDATLKRVQDWYKGFPATVTQLGAMPTDALVGGGGSDVGEGMTSFARVLMGGHEDTLDPTEKGKLANINSSGASKKQALASAYILATSTTKTATALLGKLEVGDEKMLQEAMKRINALYADGMKKDTNFDPDTFNPVIKGELTTAIAAADTAVKAAVKAKNDPPLPVQPIQQGKPPTPSRANKPKLKPKPLQQPQGKVSV